MAESDYLTLEFDDGEEMECEILGVFEDSGNEYIAIVPQDNSGDVYIYGYKQINDEDFDLVDIEDEEFSKAAKAFEEIIGAEDDEETEE